MKAPALFVGLPGPERSGLAPAPLPSAPLPVPKPTPMTPEEFRQAYFEQYAEEGDVCNETWFQRYFDDSTDWLEVEYRAPDEGVVVYSDPESDVGGYWAATSGGVVEGPFQTMGELAVALGYSPRNFPPDGETDDDFDDLDADLDEEGEEDDDAPEFDDEFEDAEFEAEVGDEGDEGDEGDFDESLDEDEDGR